MTRRPLGLASRALSVAGIVLAAGVVVCWAWARVNRPVVFSRGSARATNFVSIQPDGVRLVRQSATPPAAGSDVSPDVSELDVMGASRPGSSLAGFLDGRAVDRRLGFSWYRREMGYHLRAGTLGGSGPPAGPDLIFVATRTSLLVPYWFLVLLFLLPALIRGGVAVRRGRRAPSPFACPRCGYDLRATPDRCPECGREAPPPPADALATGG